MTGDGKYVMREEKPFRIVVTDFDRETAISNFTSVFAMAKIKVVLGRHLKHIRERLKGKLKKFRA